MDVLSIEEAKNYTGGFKLSLGAGVFIGAFVSFVLGFINGFLDSTVCSK